MMKTFALDQASQAQKIADLQVVVDAGGVKAMAAKTQLDSLKAADVSSVNALEARIAAAIKKGGKKADEQIAAYEQAKADGKKAEDEAKKAALAARKAAA